MRYSFILFGRVSPATYKRPGPAYIIVAMAAANRRYEWRTASVIYARSRLKLVVALLDARRLDPLSEF